MLIYKYIRKDMDMKKGLLMLFAAAITTSVLAYSYDTKVPVPGKTLADGKLQSEMLFPVYAYGLRIAAPDCQEYAITDTVVSKAKENGNWEEIWTVKACTRTARIPIKFTITESGTDFAIDPMGVKVAK